MVLPENIQKCLESLWSQGHEAHIVGGCVRDSFLNREPADWDVCTSALPEETIACFPAHMTVPTGLAHGTVTILGAPPVEVTTFRTDGIYLDHRRPENVVFNKSLQEDLARRDFTVNAMAWNPRDGLTDPFGGRQDLESHMLRCVGDPEVRFGEDALRILRFYRLAAQLDFHMDPQTRMASHTCRNDLLHIAPERISRELSRLLICPKPSRILEEMTRQGVLTVILPEFAPCIGFQQHTPYHNRTVDAHTFAAVDASPPDLVLRLTMLLHDIAKPCCFRLDAEGIGHCKGHDEMGAGMAEGILTRLRFDTRTITQVTRLISLHSDTMSDKDISIKYQLSQLGEKTFRQLVEVKMADTRAKEPSMVQERLNILQKIQNRVDDILLQNPCLTLDCLAVNGKDLMALGLEGPQVGQTLRRLLDMVVMEIFPNDRDTLLQQVQKDPSLPLP